jgi:hypothetical protein
VVSPMEGQFMLGSMLFVVLLLLIFFLS